MSTSFRVLTLALAAAMVLANAAGVVRAALPIELEVAADQAAPPGAMQEWGRLLSKMDLARLRLRGRTPADEPKLTTSGEGEGKRYRVVGILNRRNELVVPDGRFSQSDFGPLKKFFEGLPERVEEAAIERGMFGLTKEGFESLFDDFSVPVEVSTKNVPPADAVAAISRDLKTPIELSAEAKAVLKQAPPLAAELKGMSRGSALAAALRPAGLAIVPEEPRGKPATLRVAAQSPSVPGWPVGWKPQVVDRQVAPPMYRVTVVEIDGYTLARALAALEPHMGVPLIFDQRILTARAIDPSKVKVNFPRGKTYIRRAVDRILSQGRLAGELRVDEAGRGFYWITQFGNDSPRATK